MHRLVERASFRPLTARAIGVAAHLWNALLWTALVSTAFLCASCAEPADVAGEYTVTLTNGANGCMLSGWTEGESSTGTPVTITQDGEEVNADVGGIARIYLDLALGSHIFNGRISGDHLDLSIPGTVNLSQGGCDYTLLCDMDADANGDFIEGTLTWRALTDSHPDCGALATCRNTQSFNGTRPPR